MEKNGVKGQSRSIFMLILSIGYLAIFSALIILAIKTKEDIFFIAISVLTAFLLLLNIRLIFLNLRKVKAIHLDVRTETSTSLHPLELYMIDCLWHHRKKKFTKRQVYSALLYEVEMGRLEFIDKGIKIVSTVNLNQLSIYSLITLEMTLFNQIDCRKIRRLKMMKLKSLQEEEVSILTEDIKDNVSSNTSDTHLFEEQTVEMKKKYFTDIESSNAVYLNILSWICIVLITSLAIYFMNEATVLNFYLPIILSVLTVAGLTSKNRERVTIKKEAKEEISSALNYVRYLNNYEKNRVNELYAYCLAKSNDSRIVNPFNI